MPRGFFMSPSRVAAIRERSAYPVAGATALAERGTSLELYRQSQEDERPSGQKIWEPDGSLIPEIEASVCTDPWAIRHRMVDTATGESFTMCCDRYKCLHCGPKKVANWRSLVELAGPERFITLSRVGDTLVEVGRVITVITRRLRRLG